ncbi:MAG: DUF721 domain-containing protein [Sphingomonadaceae bacterium]|nr:DUF721 domain-containing protein [Sphingomonadaceae bacterium]
MAESGKTGRPKGVGTTRTGSVRSVADIMPGVSRAAFRRFGFVQSAIVARWPEIVGEKYAKHSAPDALSFPPGKRSGATLTIVCSGSFATMLQHVEPQIIERVNRFFGYSAVARVSLKHGELPPRPSRDAKPELKPLSAEMVSMLKPIGDPGLRASLEALAQQIAVTKGPPVFD